MKFEQKWFSSFRSCLNDNGWKHGQMEDGQKVITIAHPEHSSGELKILVTYFFMRNPYMKFQNISIHGSKLMLYTIKQH